MSLHLPLRKIFMISFVCFSELEQIVFLEVIYADYNKNVINLMPDVKNKVFLISLYQLNLLALNL